MMADEAPPPKETPPKPKKKLPLTLIIVLGVAIAEAGAFFAVFQYIGRGPAAAQGAGSHAAAAAAEGEAGGDAAAGQEGENGGEAKAEGGHGEAKPAGGEAQAEKEGAHGAKEGAAKGSVTGLAEVLVVKNFRVPNNKSGRLFIYDIDLSIVVTASDKERLEKTVKERNAEIADTIAQIIRRASEKTLTEDDLRALRYQIREGLLEIIHDEKLVQRVLIPRFVPIRAD